MFVKTIENQLVNLDAATKILWQEKMGYEEDKGTYDLVAVIAGQREILVTVAKTDDEELSRFLDVFSKEVVMATNNKKFSIDIRDVVTKLMAKSGAIVGSTGVMEGPRNYE